jgi:hypothetical protein
MPAVVTTKRPQSASLPLPDARRFPDMLVMHVIFQDISTSRCGCLSTELEASRCPCLIRA